MLGEAAKARLGVLVPSNDRIQEPELYKLRPEGVTIHFGRLWFPESNNSRYLTGLRKYIPTEARKLSHAKVDVISFGCTSGSFIGGPGYDRRIIAMIERATGTPATTTTTSVINALRYIGAQKIAVVTPYEDWINKIETEYLEDNKFEVTAITSLGCKTGNDIASVKPRQLIRSAKKVYTQNADAIFISCTGLQAIEIIDPLERTLGTYVVTSNQANMWMMLRTIGYVHPTKGFGFLLRSKNRRCSALGKRKTIMRDN
jgi:maleate isomerase